MTRHRWRPWNLIVGSMLALQAHSTPSVNVGMNAAFPAGPYLLELLYLSYPKPSRCKTDTK